MTIRKISTAFIVAVLLVSLVGCSTSPIDILNLAIGAAELALPLVGGAVGLPVSLTTAIDGYLSAASGAIAQASDILASPGLTDAQKSAAIVAAFAGIAAPDVPAQYQAIANAIAKVAQYIAQFLGGLPKSAGIAAAHTAAVHVPSAKDRARLENIKARALALKLAVRQKGSPQ